MCPNRGGVSAIYPKDPPRNNGQVHSDGEQMIYTTNKIKDEFPFETYVQNII